MKISDRNGKTLHEDALATMHESVVAAMAQGHPLHGADLYGADLHGADLHVASLCAADLHGASLNWQSHDLIAELLRQAAGDALEKCKIAGLVLISRDKCWNWFIAIQDPLRDWALGVLAEFVRENDGAPDELRRRHDANHAN